jgi:hypothetical protein
MIAAGTSNEAKTVLIRVFFPHQSAKEVADHVGQQCRELYAITGFSPRPSNLRFREGLVNGILASTEMLRIKTALHSTIVKGCDYILHEVVPLVKPAGNKNDVALTLEEDIAPYDVLTEASVFRMVQNSCGRG